MEITSESIKLANKISEEMGGKALIPSFAKLYSQFTRLGAGQEGLLSWSQEEAFARFDDAVLLLEVALLQREIYNPAWVDTARRAGELLEWLSHPKLNIDNLPLRLLASATYQIAGYPARATGLLQGSEIEENESKIINALLRADFPELLKLITNYWKVNLDNKDSFNTLTWHDTDKLHYQFRDWILRELTGAMGVICAYMRWGTEPRLTRAIDKILAVTKIAIHGNDPYSWLLAKLCSEVAMTYIDTSMRHYLRDLSNLLSEDGQRALERYLRLNYLNKKTLAWPSQARGIEKLITHDSFALFTPTGSGKTTVAELAILQSLFSKVDDEESSPPLSIYLVPSRALATEIESKLSYVMRKVSNNKVVITGLYGGADWGPTDSWLTTDKPTVLICTYEKAEALMRFLGRIFINRLSLIVIDEAHSVQYDDNLDTLKSAENRALRLESLGTRLLSYVDQNKCRIVALSAVVSGIENALSNWIAGQFNTKPAQTSYRSTRQLIGRLECLPNRRFEIRYDLLDNSGLKFEDGDQTDVPYIPKLFGPHPHAQALEEGGPEKKLRPYLFWAALNFAAPDHQGRQHSVLISITQNIGGYAEDLLTLLDKTWRDTELPMYFTPPTDTRKVKLWKKCLLSCEDYYGITSREYRLLKKGIVVHHGKMPGIMARLLIELIQERIANVVLATSTLSEGVNLPFEIVLIPTLKRWSGYLSTHEFRNLVGRAGRPGFSTEGKSLVLLEPRRRERSRIAWNINNSTFAGK